MLLSVCPSVLPSVTHLWTRYFENNCIDGNFYISLLFCVFYIGRLEFLQLRVCEFWIRRWEFLRFPSLLRSCIGRWEFLYFPIFSGFFWILDSKMGIFTFPFSSAFLHWKMGIYIFLYFFSGFLWILDKMMRIFTFSFSSAFLHWKRGIFIFPFFFWVFLWILD